MHHPRPWPVLRALVAVACLLGLCAPALAQSPRQETLQSNAAATGTGTQASTLGYSLAAVQIVGTGFTGTLTFEASVDGATYTAVMCTSMADTATTSTTATGDGTWFCPIAGAQKFRARLSSYSAGAVTVKATLMPQVSRPAPAASTGGGGTVTSITGGTCLSGGTISSSGTLSVTPDCIGPTQIDETANYTWSGTERFTGTFSVPHSTSLPGTCTVGDAYMDTDATSGARWYLCESSNTWVAQGGTGTVTGSGTTGTIPVWASATALGNSGLTDNGSVLTVNRGVRGKVAAKSADYTLTTADYQIDCTAGSGGLTLTLPSASGLTGQQYLVYKVDTDVGACAISPNGSDLLNGVNGAVTSLTTAYAGLAITQVSSTAWTVTSLGPLTIGDTISASTDASVLIVGTSSVLGQVAPGTDGQVFTMVAGVPAWAAGGVAIGDPVAGGTAGSVLWLDTGGVLAQDNAHLGYRVNDFRTDSNTLYIGPVQDDQIDGASVAVLSSEHASLNDLTLISASNAMTLVGYRSRGGLASPSVLEVGDPILNIIADGYGNSGFRQAAQIGMALDAAFSGATVPGRITFETSVVGAGSIEHYRITSAGTTAVDATACTSNGSTHCLAGQVEMQTGKLLHSNAVTNPADTYRSLYDLAAVTITSNTSNTFTGALFTTTFAAATGIDMGTYVLAGIGGGANTDGNISAVTGLDVSFTVSTSGTLGTLYGAFIGAHTATSATSKYGLYIDALGAATSAYGLYIATPNGGGTDDYSLYAETAGYFGTTLQVVGNFTQTPPSTQTITAGATISANACGGLKRISSASAVTTSTSNTLTAPAAANAGCVMEIVNVNASDAITLDKNANILLTGGADLVLGAGCSIIVVSTGAGGVWRQISAQLCSS